MEAISRLSICICTASMLPTPVPCRPARTKPPTEPAKTPKATAPTLPMVVRLFPKSAILFLAPWSGSITFSTILEPHADRDLSGLTNHSGTGGLLAARLLLGLFLKGRHLFRLMEAIFWAWVA